MGVDLLFQHDTTPDSEMASEDDYGMEQSTYPGTSSWDLDLHPPELELKLTS